MSSAIAHVRSFYLSYYFSAPIVDYVHRWLAAFHWIVARVTRNVSQTEIERDCEQLPVPFSRHTAAA